MGTAIFLLLRSVDPLPLGELLQALPPFAGLSCILGAVPALTVGLARGLAAPARPGDLAQWRPKVHRKVDDEDVCRT